jgi:hypothetical protein
MTDQRRERSVHDPDDILGEKMGWIRPILNTPEEKTRKLAAIDAGLHEARSEPPRRRKRQ